MAEINNESDKFKIAVDIIGNLKTAEANLVSAIYQQPELLHENDLTEDMFTDKVWRMYFKIAYDLVKNKKIKIIDDIVVGSYVIEHKLNDSYDKYGGWQTIQNSLEYFHVENFESNLLNLRKWKSVLELAKKGFPVKDRISDFSNMTIEEIYEEYDAYLNNIFANSISDVKSYNGFEDMHGFIDELNECKDVGIPFYNTKLLNAETGGFNINGNIYALGGNSGAGKSTMAFNLLVPTCIKYNERIVFFINEEDERKMKKELIVWVVNNVISPDKPIQKRVLRDGKFNEETLNLLRKAADWIEAKKEEHILTIIPLETYTVDIVIKLIKKYSSAFGVRMFVLDTFKESDNAKDEMYKSMMRDMRKLYDIVKPAARNVGLFVTYQLGKSSIKVRHLTNNDIGQAKSIRDVMSVNIMIRRPFDDEYDGEKKELKCYKIPEGSKGDTRVQYKLEKDKHPMILFITKNRFGETDERQIVLEANLSTNVIKDVAYCCVPQDW